MRPYITKQTTHMRKPICVLIPKLPKSTYFYMQLMRSDNQIPQHSQEQAKRYTDLDKLQNDH